MYKNENAMVSEHLVQMNTTLEKVFYLLKRGVQKASEEFVNSERNVVTMNEKTFLEKFSRYLTKEFEDYSIISVDSKFSTYLRMQDRKEVVRRIFERMPDNFLSLYRIKYTHLPKRVLNSLLPDIVVHERGTILLNLLSICIVRNTGGNEERLAHARLKTYTDPTLPRYYRFGVMILFRLVNGSPEIEYCWYGE